MSWPTPSLGHPDLARVDGYGEDDIAALRMMTALMSALGLR
jgi:hypothetical protein